MPTSDLPAAVEAMSARIMVLEALVYAIADACSDRAALRSVLDVYVAGSEAKLNGLPVGDRYLELLRVSLDDMRAVIDQRRSAPRLGFGPVLPSSCSVVCAR